MTSQTCHPCGRPVANGFLCEGCTNRLRNYLTDLQALNGELHTALTRMVRMTERSEGGRSFEKPLVFNLAAAETIRLIRSTLVSWVREIHADTAAALPDTATVTSLTDWLLSQLEEVRSHREDASDMYDEVKHLRDKAQEVVDLPVNRTTYEVGPCPEDVDDKPCEGHVWAIIPRDEEKRPRLQCRTCRAAWYGEQWHNVGRRILARHGKPLNMDPEAVRELMERIA